ncbi:MAG: LamG-like jellyroll fold domain-containing protein, partial [Sedimentisphaerales bacterium]
TVEHDDGLEHHFVATVNATDITFYIDGALIGSAPLAAGNEIAGIGQAVAYLGKGVYPVDPLWTGSINEFNIYNRALSIVQVQANYAAGPVKPLVHQYTFEDGTANDSVGSAHGTLVGDAAVVGGALVLDGDGDWMEMPGEVIAMNTYSEVTIETWFTSVAGGNTGFHMLAAFGEEGTGAADWAGYKYLFITPARGDDVSRAAIQTSSMDDSPWDEETGVSATVEHDDGLEHHFVCTVNATDIVFYIDGELIGSAPLAAGNEIAGIGQAVAHLGKGVYPVDPLWTGSINEFNIYNRALSLAEIKANYAAGPQKAGPAPVDPGTEGLMMHLPLDTASRGVTQDSSDNDHDGTLFGDPIFVEGVVVMALEFDGVDDYVDTGYTEDLADWTISAWVRSPTAPSGDSPSGPVHREKNYQFNWNHSNEVFRGSVTVNAGGWHAASFETLEANTWYHLAGTYDGEELKAYKDGVLITTNDAPSGPPVAETGTLKLGRHATAEQYFTGTVDEVRIYNRALSAEGVLFLAGM